MEKTKEKQFCSGCRKGCAFFSSSCESGLECSACGKEIRRASK